MPYQSPDVNAIKTYFHFGEDFLATFGSSGPPPSIAPSSFTKLYSCEEYEPLDEVGGVKSHFHFGDEFTALFGGNMEEVTTENWRSV